MKRSDDFWVTEPFSCYFLWKERLRCRTDKVTDRALEAHTKKKVCTSNTVVQMQPYILHLLRFQRMKVNSWRIKMLLEIVADLI